LPTAARRAILLVIGAAAVFTLAGACAKALGGAIPLMQVIFCRNLFAIPVLLPLLMQAGGWRVLRTRNPAQHAMRAGWGMLGMVGAFYGYVHLPLATVTALGFTMPLFLTALSVPLLGQTVGWRRTTAILVGFAGVMLMVRPGVGEALNGGAVALCLLGALAWAFAMVSIRRLGERGEPGVAIVLWFAILSAGFAGLAALPVWIWPDLRQWALLVAIGVVSALAQMMMTEAYRRSDTTLIAPFEYSAILWTTVLGALVWSELPDVWDALGILVLVSAGLYIWHRETRLGLRR
jgi:drug/metabolite transporter (DMT)-like permease